MDQNILTQLDVDSFERDGYLIVRSIYTAGEITAIRSFFDEIGQHGPSIPGFFEPDFTAAEPLKRYPRAMHPHRWNELSRRMMLHPRVDGALAQLIGQRAVACQTMFYFKPPGSAGQSLHQDNFYLAVKPGTCIAAWTAIDPATTENGCMYVVPNSHRMDISCPDADDLARTKSTNLVDLPPGMKAVPAVMEPGDTLFFNGSVVHGSGRNRSNDLWRRSFICHYMPANSTHVNGAYFPIYDFEGNEISYEAAASGGPCGYAVGAVANTYGVDAQFH